MSFREFGECRDGEHCKMNTAKCVRGRSTRKVDSVTIILIVDASILGMEPDETQMLHGENGTQKDTTKERQ